MKKYVPTRKTLLSHARVTTGLITIDVVARARRTTDVRIAPDGLSVKCVHAYNFFCGRKPAAGPSAAG